MADKQANNEDHSGAATLLFPFAVPADPWIHAGIDRDAASSKCQLNTSMLDISNINIYMPRFIYFMNRARKMRL